MRDGHGNIIYYLTLEAELNWFSHLVRAIPPVRDAMAAIVDTTGLIIARQPDDERFAGARHEVRGPMREMVGRDSGFVQGVGLDSVERVYAFRALPTDNAAQVLLMIETNRRDGARKRGDDVGRVVPASQTNLDHRNLDAGPAE